MIPKSRRNCNTARGSVRFGDRLCRRQHRRQQACGHLLAGTEKILQGFVKGGGVPADRGGGIRIFSERAEKDDGSERLLSVNSEFEPFVLAQGLDSGVGDGDNRLLPRRCSILFSERTVARMKSRMPARVMGRPDLATLAERFSPRRPSTRKLSSCDGATGTPVPQRENLLCSDIYDA